MDWDKVGEVTHFFDRISVASIILEQDLAIGDHIGFVRQEELLFEQQVTSMQVEHANISFARAGDEVGLKVSHEVKAGTEVYKQV